jgi:hypothetical protein
MFKKIDGYYWVKTSNTSSIGYPTLHELFVDRFVYGWIGIGLLSLSALLNVVVLVAKLMA